jgi:hypothetical protein
MQKTFVEANFDHILFVILLISRLGDVLSTYLATPNLALEANFIVGKLRWKFAIATIAISFVAYYDASLAVALIVPSILVSSANFGKVWMMRTMGEYEYRKLILNLARRSNLRTYILYVFLSSFFMASLGLLLLFFYPNPNEDWGFWFAMGIVGFAFVTMVHFSISGRTMFKEVASLSDAISQDTTII